MNLLLIILLSLLNTLCFSQTAESIQTDRPGIGIGASVAGKQVFQIQSGVTYDQNRGVQSLEQFTLDNYVRYGLSEHFELNAVANFTQLDIGNTELNGISHTQLGFRVNLRNKPKSKITGFGLQFSLKLPWESRDFESEDVSGVLILAMTQNLNDIYGLAYNLGISENQATDKITGFYTIGLSRSLTSKWGTFIELAGNLDDGDHDLIADTGLSYLWHKNLQLDFSFGGGRNDGVSAYFISTGVSWRCLP